MRDWPRWRLDARGATNAGLTVGHVLLLDTWSDNASLVTARDELEARRSGHRKIYFRFGAVPMEMQSLGRESRVRDAAMFRHAILGLALEWRR